MMKGNDFIDNLKKQGLALIKSKRLEEAKALLMLACNQDATDAEAWYMLGMTNNRLGRSDEAAHCFIKSIAINPDQPEAHYKLAKTHEFLGDLEAALTSMREVERLEPDFDALYPNMGAIQQSMGKLEEALASYSKAARLEPENAETHYNVGQVLKALGRYNDAATCYRTACQLQPDFIEAIYNMATVLHALGNTAEAIEIYKQAILIKPDFLPAFVGLGNALREAGFMNDAIECYKHIVSLKPDLAGAYHNLAIMLRLQSRVDEAEKTIREELKLQPDSVMSQITLGDIYIDQGKVEDAIRIFQKLLQRDPHNSEVHWKLIMSMHYLPTYSADNLFDEARRWGISHTPPAEKRLTPANAPNPQRRLRVGYVSGDFYIHPVGHFIESVLAHHDKSQHEIYCYYNNTRYDELTENLKRSADHWRNISSQGDDAVAEQIRQDQIDILIDLSGHTAKTRMLLFARKPAPVQVTWLGYFDTTGLTTIDYIIGDRYLIPSEEERHYTEQVARMPNAYLCFTPPDSDIAPNPLPALTSDRITFGCFNNNAKLTEGVIACWSKILHALPQAQLYLKYPPFGDAQVRQRYFDLFATQGIAAERIRLTGHSPRHEYLAAYQEVDLGLDPFPFNGCTTTMESLWMGVPVVTLRGDRYVGHMGETILKHLDLAECVTDSEEAYIDRAIALVSDLPRLAALRSGLRDRLLKSPLCDGPGFTRDLEAVYRRMWDTWCQTQAQPG